MLKYITCLVVGLMAIGQMALAQLRPSGFSYQAVVTTANGPLVNTKVTLVATLHTPTNTPVWREVLSTRTDASGAASITLGIRNSLPNGVPLFANLDFTTVHLAMKVEVTSPVSMVISDEPLQTVPYARYAKSAPSKIPPGIIVAFAGDTTKIPLGWKLCNGALLNKDSVDRASGIAYKRLYDVIGFNWGSNSANTFRVPDLRGLFLRGVNGASGNDPNADQRTRLYPGGNAGNRVGSYQKDTLENHHHQVTFSRTSVNAAQGTTGQYVIDGGQSNMTTESTGLGVETRPKNAYVNYIIKL